jgi:hypothetical protein
MGHRLCTIDFGWPVAARGYAVAMLVASVRGSPRPRQANISARCLVPLSRSSNLRVLSSRIRRDDHRFTSGGGRAGARMELAFRTRQLRALCEDQSKAAEVFGEAVVDALRRRLADIRAADSLRDLVVGSPTIESGDDPQVTFALAGTHRLVCRTNHRTPLLDSSGRTDWYRVRRLLVTAIEEGT